MSHEKLSTGIIYGLICPNSKKIRYVGQTKSKSHIGRLSAHIRESFYEKDSYSHKERWIRKNHSDSTPITSIIIERCDISELDEKEKYWISKYNNLTNIQTGGTHGYTWTEEKRKQYSISRMGENNPMYGIKRNMKDCQKRNISDALLKSDVLKISRKSEEYRNKLSKINSKNTWIITDQDFNIVHSCENSKKILEYFINLNINFSLSNIKNARRFKRPIGKCIGKNYYISYLKDLDELKINHTKPRFNV